VALGAGFRLFGVPVRIEWTFLLMAVAIGLTGRSGVHLLIWVAVVFVSILVHELGHALTFRAFGQHARIRLYAFGGLTYGDGGPLSSMKHILVSAAGSTAGIVLLGIPSYLLVRADVLSSTTWRLALGDLAWVSLGWGLLNLLPLLPLDGGNIAATILTVLAAERGNRLARFVSLGTAGAAAAWAFLAHLPFLALYALIFAGINMQQLAREREVRLGERIRDGYRSLNGDDPQAAIRTAETVLAKGRSPGIRSRALELQAWALLAANQPHEAQHAVEGLPEGTTPSLLLLGCLSLAAGDREKGTHAVAQGLLRDPAKSAGGIVAQYVAEAGIVDDLVDRLLSMRISDGPIAAHALSHDLHVTGRFQESARVNERLYDDGRPDRSLAAYNRACSLARMGSLRDALEWLRRATDSGWKDAVVLDADPDLEALRPMEEFNRLRAELASTESLGTSP
jgi:Zn-dependent protease